MRLYGDVAPSLMTDEQIEYTIKEIDQDLAACKKLKEGPWLARYTNLNTSWQDDPETNTVGILAPGSDPFGGLDNPGMVRIAGGTIYDTQREVFFMAAMREEFPKLLWEYRAALVYIRELRKKAARKKARR